MYLYLSVHWKAPKSYYFKTIRSLLIVHKHEKTNYESLLDNSAPIFTIFNANVELKQESRAIIREKTTLCMQKRTIKKSSKPILCYSNSYTTHRLILSRDIETNPGWRIVITNKLNQNLTIFHCLPVNYAIRQYE